MNQLNKFFSIAVVVSFVLLVYNICMVSREQSKIDALEVRYNALKAEYGLKTSWPAILTSWMKSAVNGATFGTFTESGNIFEETDKQEKWLRDVAQREAEIKTEVVQSLRRMSSFKKGRRRFGLLAFFALIGALATGQRKNIKPL